MNGFKSLQKSSFVLYFLCILGFITYFNNTVCALDSFAVRSAAASAMRPAIASAISTYLVKGDFNVTGFLVAAKSIWTNATLMLSDLEGATNDHNAIAVIAACFAAMLTVGFTYLEHSCKRRYVIQSGERAIYTGPTEHENTLQVGPMEVELDEVTELNNKSDNDDLWGAPCYLGSCPCSGTTLGQVCASYSLTDFVKTPAFKRISSLFKMYKFDLEFTMTMNGNPMAAGTMICFMKPSQHNHPLVGLYGSKTVTNPLAMALALPHVLVDVSSNSVQSLTLPWWYYKEYLTPNSNIVSYGSLNIVCLHPVVVPTGSTSAISLEISVRAVNVETRVPAGLVVQAGNRYVILNDAVAAPQPRIIELASFNDRNLPANIRGDAVTRHKTKRREHKQSIGASVGHVVDYVSNAASTVWSYIKPAAKFIGAFFGLDKPSDLRVLQTTATRGHNKLTYASGAVDAWRPSFDPSTLTLMDVETMKRLSIDTDEMDLDYYRGREHFVASLNFGLTQAKGSLIAYEAVGAPRQDGISPAGPCSIMHLAKYWRGTFTYRISFPKNQFRQAKLMMVMFYGAAPVPQTLNTTGGVDPRSQPCKIFDISNEDGFCEMDVPFISSFPMLRCNYGAWGGSNITNNDRFEENYLGVFAVYLVTPMTITSTAPNTAYLTLSKKMGGDFALYDYRTGPAQFAQSLVPSAQTFINHIAVISNLRELAMMPVLYHRVTSVNSDFTLPIYPGFLYNNPVWSWMLNNYAGCCGSLRVIIRVCGNAEYDVQAFDGLNNLQSTSLTFGTSLSEPIATGEDKSKNFSTIMPTCSRGGSHHVASHVVGRATPELVVDLANCVGLYRTNPWIPVSNGSMQPNNGFRQMQNVPYINFNRIMQSSNTVADQGFLSVHLAAGDDFRCYWYTGGATSSIYQTSVDNGDQTLMATSTQF